MVTNREMADKLDEFGRVLELKDANVFKIRAFQNASRTVQSLSSNLETIYEEGGVDELQEIDGIGDSISKIIKEYIETGEIEELIELKQGVPPELLDMIEIEGLGPKRVIKLHEELDIKTLDELETAAQTGKVEKISGFGKKTQHNILDGIERFRRGQERTLRMKVQPEAEHYINLLNEKFRSIKRIELAGSLRRKKSTIGDVDILIQAEEDLAEDIMEFIRNINEVDRVLVSGSKKTSVITNTDLQIDVRVISDPSEYAGHLQYFTGSKEHNIEVRKIAIARDLKLSEYGLEKEDGTFLDLHSEEEIYNHLGLQYIPPELREDRGEIELAKENNLPELLTKDMVQADFHVHTNWSGDGTDSIEDMATAARDRGLSYLVFTDHTQDLAVVNGMDEERIQEQMTKIRQINDELPNIELLCGAELNIDNQGGVDLDEDTLDMLDFAIASIHSGFKQDAEKLTDRIMTAMTHDKVKVIAHPTGRKVNKRDPYAINLDEIVDAAIDNDVALEINGSQRQDLSDIIVHSLRDSEVKFSLSSDAHAIGQLVNLDYSIDLARRGWVDPERIINTLSLNDFKQTYGI